MEGGFGRSVSGWACLNLYTVASDLPEHKGIYPGLLADMSAAIDDAGAVSCHIIIRRWIKEGYLKETGEFLVKRMENDRLMFKFLHTKTRLA